MKNPKKTQKPKKSYKITKTLREITKNDTAWKKSHAFLWEVIFLWKLASDLESL